MPAVESLAYQSREFRGIFLQIQARGLAECTPQDVTHNLAGVIIKPAFHLFFDNCFQFMRERNIHVDNKK